MRQLLIDMGSAADPSAEAATFAVVRNSCCWSDGEGLRDGFWGARKLGQNKSQRRRREEKGERGGLQLG